MGVRRSEGRLFAPSQSTNRRTAPMLDHRGSLIGQSNPELLTSKLSLRWGSLGDPNPGEIWALNRFFVAALTSSQGGKCSRGGGRQGGGEGRWLVGFVFDARSRGCRSSR